MRKIFSNIVCFSESLNFTKLNLDDHGNILDSFKISLEFIRSFRGSLLPKPVTGQELFFAISYSKPALANKHFSNPEYQKSNHKSKMTINRLLRHVFIGFKSRQISWKNICHSILRAANGRYLGSTESIKHSVLNWS